MTRNTVLAINLKKGELSHKKCSDCGKAFISSEYLSRHVSRRHKEATQRLQRLLDKFNHFIVNSDDTDNETSSGSENTSDSTDESLKSFNKSISPVSLLAHRLHQLGLDPNQARLDDETSHRVLALLDSERNRHILNDTLFENLRLANELKLERALTLQRSTTP